MKSLSLMLGMENTEEEQDADFVNAENESVPNVSVRVENS